MWVIDVYEVVWNKVVKFINVRLLREIVYICNVMEVINLVVYSWGMNNFKVGDEIIIIVMEYYSNLVFW